MRDELLEYIAKEAIGIFYCEPDDLPGDEALWWDVDKRPHYKEFFQAAKLAGVRLMYFYEQVFDDHSIEQVEDSLELGLISEEDQRALSRRLAEFRGYLGFLCRVGVGFSLDSRMHWFDVHAPWYYEYLDLLDDVRLLEGTVGLGLGGEEDDDEDDEKSPPRGGFYSKN